MIAFEGLCRERGVPVTLQRRAIYEAVLESAGHPSADDVHARVKQKMAGVSKVTVYRVLETLVRMGVIGKASHPGAATRYDVNTERHHHLVCTRCDRTADLTDAALDRLRLPAIRAEGFEIADFSIHFTGLCKACRQTAASRHRKPSK